MTSSGPDGYSGIVWLEGDCVRLLATARDVSRGLAAFDMDVPEEPLAVAVLAVFVVIGFLFLLCLGKGCLPERRQTRVWIVFAVWFFSLCHVLIRANTESRARQTDRAPVQADTKGVRR